MGRSLAGCAQSAIASWLLRGEMQVAGVLQLPWCNPRAHRLRARRLQAVAFLGMLRPLRVALPSSLHSRWGVGDDAEALRGPAGHGTVVFNNPRPLALLFPVVATARVTHHLLAAKW